MPQYDLDRDTVKNALVKDGWVITDDPFVIESPYYLSTPYSLTSIAQCPAIADNWGRRVKTTHNQPQI